MRVRGERGERNGERAVAEPALRMHAIDRAGESRADDVVGGAGEDRRDHALELLGRVLAVGVAERDRSRVERERGGEPGADGGAEAARRLGDDVGTGALGLGRGRVAGSVVDHDDVHRVAADLGRRAGDDVADGPLLVAGGQDEHQRPGHQGTLTMVRLP